MNTDYILISGGTQSISACRNILKNIPTIHFVFNSKILRNRYNEVMRKIKSSILMKTISMTSTFILCLLYLMMQVYKTMMANITVKPLYQTVKDIIFPSHFSPKQIKEVISYKPTPEDVFIVTYPKCGTTWMQNIVLYIFRKGKLVTDHKDFRRMCPFIDKNGNESIYKMPRPGAFKTHLPFTHVPYSPDAKYIYVLRNPKDCCVSMYYHTKSLPGYWEAEFSDFFEIFMCGEVEYNDYFDHLDSWYPHRNDKNVFFTTYENMKPNKRDIVLKLANFLGREYIDVIEKDSNVLNNILQFSEFDYMKKHFADLFDGNPGRNEEKINPDLPEGMKEALKCQRPEHIENIKFLRKGVVGDWRNHFSPEQSERMNEKFLKRTEGTEILEMYKPFMEIN